MIIKTAVKNNHMTFIFSITMRLSTHNFESHNVTTCIYSFNNKTLNILSSHSLDLSLSVEYSTE